MPLIRHQVNERFGARIREIRVSAGLSQEALAKALRRNGESHLAWRQATISKVEIGERPVTLGEAAELAEILDVPVAAFFADDPVGPPKVDRAILELQRVRHSLDERIRQLQGD